MMNNKKIYLSIYLLLLLFLLNFYIVWGVEDFKLISTQTTNSMCQGSTVLYTTIIQNTGTSFNQYTVNTVGDATSWSTTVPLGFSLKPGESKVVYTYVSPGFNVNAGDYSLDIVVSSTQLSKKVSYTASVQNCYKVDVNALEKAKNICPGESTRYDFKITNLGEYRQQYILNLEGSGATYATLSQSSLDLDSKREAVVSVFVSNIIDKIGEFDISLIARSPRGMDSDNVKLNVLSCFDYSLQIEKTFLNVCDHTTTITPITIRNSGSLPNSYELKIKGPEWTALENNNILVDPAREGKINLIASPDYGISGSYDVNVESKSENGNIIKSNDIKINVKSCNSVEVNILESKTKICGSLSNKYNILVKNTGEVFNRFNLNLKGVDWAALDKNIVELNAGQEAIIILTVSPNRDIKSDKYNIEIEAIGLQGKITSKDTIETEVVSAEKCYEPSLSIDKKSIDVVAGDSVTVPVIIENKGSNAGDYSIGISGDAVNFVQVNPAAIKLEPGKSEIIYLYIAPSVQHRLGDYSLSVSVRYDETTILDSEELGIKVIEKAGIKVSEVKEEKKEEKVGIFSLIWSYKWYILVALIVLFILIRILSTKREEDFFEEIEELKKEDEKKEKKLEKKEVKEIKEKEKKKEEKKEEIIKEVIEEEVKDYKFIKYLIGLIILATIVYIAYSYNYWRYVLVYKWYILGALIVLILLLILRRFSGKMIEFFEEEEEPKKEKKVEKGLARKEEKKLEKKEVKEIKETKKEEKKEEVIEEEVKDYRFIKYLIGLIILAIIVYTVYSYKYWSHVLVYKWYLLVGFGLLFLIILLLKIGAFKSISDFFKEEDKEIKELTEERPKRGKKRGEEKEEE